MLRVIVNPRSTPVEESGPIKLTNTASIPNLTKCCIIPLIKYIIKQIKTTSCSWQSGHNYRAVLVAANAAD